MKYFEALACGTLLLASSSPELEELGFIDGETFVAVDKESIVEKVSYYLMHDEERERIIQQGRQLILNRHTTEKRVDGLLEIISKLI